MLLALDLLLGKVLCRNAVDAMVEMMASIGEKHAVTVKLGHTELNNYGYLVRSAWKEKRKVNEDGTKELEMKEKVDMYTLRNFFRDVVSKSHLDLESVELEEGMFYSSTSFVPKILYEETEDKVILRLNTYHKIYENSGYPSVSKNLVKDMQKSMTLLLVMLDICGSTNRARDVLTNTPLTLEQDYGSTHYVFRLYFDLSFETERLCFERFLDVIKGSKKLPWRLSKDTVLSISKNLRTTLYKADKDIIEYLKPLLGKSDSECSSED